MFLFDLDAATLPLGPVTEWPGSGATPGPAYGSPVAVDVDGWRAVRLTLGDSLDWFTESSPPTVFALHLVARITLPSMGGGEPYVQWGSGFAGALPWGSDGFGYDGEQTLEGAGRIATYSAISDGTSTRLYVDGVEVSSVPDTGAAGAAMSLFPAHAGAQIDALRVVGSSGTVPHLIAEMGALIAHYAGINVISVSGLSGGVEWSSTAGATTEDVWEPPLPPIRTPGGSVEPPEDPEPQNPPAKVTVEPLRRLSEIMPAPSLDERGNPVDWSPSFVVQERIGRIQIVVEGVDITYWGDVETPFPSYSRVEPFGADQATLELPQITAFHQPGEGALGWLREGANVSIRRIIPDAPNVRVWRGVIAGFGHDEDSGIFTVDCLGIMFTADLQLRQPPFVTTPQDAGRFIADTLNRTVGRRFKKVSRVVTGCKTSVLGGWEPRVTGAIGQVLATSVKGGRQWTVKCADRSPVIELKDTETINWTIRNGQRGIAVNLVRDVTQAPNVIFGEGVTPAGGRWRNAKYPNWAPDATPDYPGPLSQGMTVGFRDGQTTSGEGVSVWQERAGQKVTGVLSQDDRVAWRRIQSDAGIQVDNFLGPQTWAASFQTGSNTGVLDGAFIAPLARSAEVEPYRYGPDGDRLGDNPRYDPSVIRVERYINFGAGVTRSEGRRAAQEMLARDSDPGWVGTVTFRLDPNEGSKYDIVREGTNGLIRSFRGQTLRVHVARVEYRADEVVATVDTHARDYPTLDAILDRERSATDPARAYRRQQTSSTLSSERATWDAESPGGRIPRHALFAGLWNVLRIPVAQYGTIVRTRFTTDTPAAFSVAVFDREISAGTLVSLVGNPLSGASNPWQDKADDLDDAGLLMAWGWKEQPAGYYPREYSSPDSENAAPMTGRMLDDSSWEYASSSPPWLWVAMIADRSCRIEGRFWQGTS